MATKYVSALTGSEMDSALQDMAYHNSEAWAVGTRNGTAVSSSDVTYHNNSKYYSDKVSTDTQRAEDAAARAEAAVPAGTAGAVFFDTAQSLTASQQAQARANIMAGGTNPNLLDNPFFASDVVINQRGVTSGSIGTTTSYIVDRWLVNRCNYSVTSNGLQQAWDGVNSSSGTISQRTGRFDFIGKTVTFSVIIDDELYSFTTTAPSSGAVDHTTTPNTSIRIAYNATYGINVVIFNYSTTPIVVKAAKLELGSASTLANDVPPDYGTELEKCKYYFERLKYDGGNYGIFGHGLAISSTIAYIFVPMHPKRTMNPTITSSGSKQLYGTSSATISAITTDGSCSKSMLALYVTSSGLTAGAPYMFRANNDGSAYIDISADL